jgi:glucose/arabinose dehydrogenase
MRLLAIALVAVLIVSGCADSDEPASIASRPTTIPEATPVSVPTTVGQTTAAPTTREPAVSTTPATTAPPTTQTTVPVGSLDDLELEYFEAASGFSQPVFLATPPDDERWFVVDQPGIVWLVDGADPTVFLDIRDEVRFENEQGLLGLAFHPDFAANNLFYIYYINNDGDSVVESVRADGSAADPASRTEILRLDQPAANHNGGMLQFGPDGNLWIGTGDGGGANNQFGFGQRADSLLASMLRITVGPDIDGYDIPSGNLDNEVWAIGLRNPWRWSFDGNDLWIGDVGQSAIEEVDVVDWTEGNPNFGWSILEGSECFEAETCSDEGLVLPVYQYSHSDGCSITGGVVYRGSAIPELAGQFLFADYCNGWVRSVDRSGTVREWFAPGTFTGATSFGVDAAGEVYIMVAGGSIYGFARGSS